jgi:hypothetical protein
MNAVITSDFEALIVEKASIYIYIYILYYVHWDHTHANIINSL